MIDFSSIRKRGRGQPEVIILSLIDIMMVLLIFLLTTARPGKETGLDVQRPQASTSAELDADALLVGIGPDGELSMEGRRVDLLSLSGILRQRLAARPDLGVVLVADQRTSAGALVAAMDEAYRGGARKVAVASRKEAAR